MPDPLRVLLLTQWFDPEPTFKGLVFARELVEQGCEVEVITGFPNYPGGKLYSGYKVRWLQREVIDDVNITRVPLYPSHDNSAVKRVMNYASFAFSALVYGVFFARRVDVIYAYHPPLTVGVTASLMSWLRGIPFVYDIQDMWPDTLRATGMIKSGHMLSLIGRVCDWVYRQADHLVVLSPGFVRLLVKRGVPEEKIEVIYNWANEEALELNDGSVPTDFPSRDFFRVIFAGNIGRAQALDTVLNAALILKERSVGACIVFVGGGLEADQLKARAADLCLDNVLFLPPVPMSKVGAILNEGDALLVHLRRDPLFEITIPSKTQAYMAVGKPILMAVEGNASDLVAQAKCGISVLPEDPSALADAIEAFTCMSKDELTELGLNGKRFYDEFLSLKVGAKKFVKTFNKLIK